MFDKWMTTSNYVLEPDGFMAPGPAPKLEKDRGRSRWYSFRASGDRAIQDALLTSFEVIRVFERCDAQNTSDDEDDRRLARAVMPFIRANGLLGFLPQQLLALSLPEATHSPSTSSHRLYFRTSTGWNPAVEDNAVPPGMALIQQGHEPKLVALSTLSGWFTDGNVRVPCDPDFWRYYREPVSQIAGFLMDALPRLASEAELASVPLSPRAAEAVYPDDVLSVLHFFGAPSLSWTGDAAEPDARHTQRRITPVILYPSLASFLMHRTLERICGGTARKCPADRCGRWFVIMKHHKQRYCSRTCAGRMRQRASRERNRKAKR